MLMSEIRAKQNHNHLSFFPHINKIVNNASRRAILILRCFTTRDPLVLMKAFNTFVRLQKCQYEELKPSLRGLLSVYTGCTISAIMLDLKH